MDAALLRAFLGAAVPFAILDLLEKGGPDENDFVACRAFAGELGAKGDQLLFRGKETGAMAAKVARAVAVLAFCPGGVNLFGDHYEVERDKWKNKTRPR